MREDGRGCEEGTGVGLLLMAVHAEKIAFLIPFLTEILSFKLLFRYIREKFVSRPRK